MPDPIADLFLLTPNTTILIRDNVESRMFKS